MYRRGKAGVRIAEAVEELKQSKKRPTVEIMETIKAALKHFEEILVCIYISVCEENCSNRVVCFARVSCIGLE